MNRRPSTKSPMRAKEEKIGHFAKSKNFSRRSTTTSVTTAHTAPCTGREVGDFLPLARVGQIIVNTPLTMTGACPSERGVGRSYLVDSPNLVKGGAV